MLNYNMASKQTLYEKLIELRDSDHYPYHMPGHKRNPDAGAMADYYQVDITEIDGFDNLHEAEGILRDIEQQAAELYGAEDAFMSVNGSTAGILSAVMSQTMRGDPVIMARGCHRSVYHALYLQELRARYLMPSRMLPAGIPGEITAAQVAESMDEDPSCRVVIITSPTYEGMVMDVKAISGEVHKRNGILIVDAAHGAHFGLSDAIPDNPVRLGADLVIISLHKTLPAMTQTALVLVGSGRIDKLRLKRYLSMVQSSSPSYVLMASIQESLLFAKQRGSEALRDMVQACQALKDRINQCKHVMIADAHNGFYAGAGWDPGKLVITTRSGVCSGFEIYHFLREEHHLQLEMAAEQYGLAIVTMADRPEAFERLEKALLDMDKKLVCREQKADTCIGTDIVDETVIAEVMRTVPEAVRPLWEAMDHTTEKIDLSDCEDRVAAEFVGLYPPGVPILVPGERIGEEHRNLLQRYRHEGLHVQGVDLQGNMRVCKQ